ncbi:hypothetical protein GCM10009839_69690 [Catenulispora yoronensis]|uniref:DUF6545 domain-containing protein n=1 Tax=Catenulispora yoronensis TaxID=450799 RepID=A0ABP5GVX4_9ACTN
MTCSEPVGEVGVGLSLVWLSILAVLWLVTLLLAAFPGRSPRRRPIALLFLFVSGAATLGGYGVRRWLDKATGLPDGAILAGHILGVAGVLTVLELVASLSRTTGAKQRILRTAQSLLLVDIILLVALFAAIPRQLDHPDFGCWHAQSVLVVSYEVLYQAALGTGLTVAIVLFRTRVRTVSKPLLRNASYMIISGFAVGLSYVAVRCLYLVTHAFALPYPFAGRFSFVPAVLLELMLGLFGLGTFILGFYRIGVFLRRLFRYHRLRPLWTLLDQAAPGYVLGPVRSTWADRLDIRGAEHRLYRRAIEIRDAQWELSKFSSPAMTERTIRETQNARHTPGHNAHLLSETLDLETARRAKLAGLPRTDTRPSQDSVTWSGGIDLDSESRALLAIQRLRQDPWVQETAEAIVLEAREVSSAANS